MAGLIFIHPTGPEAIPALIGTRPLALQEGYVSVAADVKGAGAEPCYSGSRRNHRTRTEESMWKVEKFERNSADLQRLKNEINQWLKENNPKEVQISYSRGDLFVSALLLYRS
jgi:aspartate oxidase